ncbi:MAG: hypothetical protein IJ371_06540 [Clostridia bacterium]|nr:hypothetical protein [Clostridia bacterium]
MITNDIRKFVRDYLNNENSLEELINYFDLKKCDRCDNYELQEDLFNTSIGDICETCKNDF